MRTSNVRTSFPEIALVNDLQSKQSLAHGGKDEKELINMFVSPDGKTVVLSGGSCG